MQISGLGYLSDDAVVPSLNCNSQATFMRRVHVAGALYLHDDYGWASGGFLSDSAVDLITDSGTQQQWLARNCDWKAVQGNICIRVNAGKDIILTGILFDAGPAKSDLLLQVGKKAEDERKSKNIKMAEVSEERGTILADIFSGQAVSLWEHRL